MIPPAKFVRRNRIGVSVAALALLAVVGCLVAALWEARQARTQRDVAQRINTFLQDMIGGVEPEAKDIGAKFSDLLNEASIRAKAELATEPAVMAGVLLALGRTYLSLGQDEPAEANLRAALEASSNGELHSTTATTMGWLGLALANRDKYAEGEKISRKAVELQRKLHPGGDKDLGVALYALGLNLSNKREPKAAQPFLQEASDLIRKHFGETHHFYTTSLITLAVAHERAGEVDAAESIVRQAIALAGQVESRHRTVLAQAQTFLAFLLANKGAYVEAETLLQGSETIYREAYGGDTNDSVGAVKADLGSLYLLKGDYERAETESRKALDLLRKYLGPEHAVSARAAATLGLTLTREGRAAEGEPYLREALAIRTKAVPLDSYLIPFTESALGECLTAQKRYAEAEPLLTDGYTGLIWKLGEKDVRTVEARQRLARLYDAWGKPDQALLFR